jgi:hypothetical protein
VNINNLKTIQSIQDEFHEKFPHLNIKFYKEAYAPGEYSPLLIKWKASRAIGDIWLQTMKKNDWTLKQQNGRAASYTKSKKKSR